MRVMAMGINLVFPLVRAQQSPNVTSICDWHFAPLLTPLWDAKLLLVHQVLAYGTSTCSQHLGCPPTPGLLGEMMSGALNIIGFSWLSCPAATELETVRVLEEFFL